MRLLLVVFAVLLSLSACGSEADAEASDPAPTQVAGPTTAPTTGTTVRTSPRGCRGQRFHVTGTAIDAAAGHRYWGIRVKNCTAEEISIANLPEVSTRGGNGDPLGTRFAPRTDDRRSVTLAAHGTAWFGLEWVPQGLGTRQAETLVVRPDGTSTHTLVPTQMDIDDAVRVRVWGWTTHRDDIFGY